MKTENDILIMYYVIYTYTIEEDKYNTITKQQKHVEGISSNTSKASKVK